MRIRVYVASPDDNATGDSREAPTDDLVELPDEPDKPDTPDTIDQRL
jgi:hypothetical protein